MQTDDVQFEERRQGRPLAARALEPNLLEGVGRPLVVLCIDNDVEHLEMITELLGRQAPHLSLRTCSDPAEGLMLAGQADVDVVLLDQSMPGMTGTELLAELRRSPELPARSVPVIMLSGAPAPLGEMGSAYVVWLQKPIQRIDDLVAAIALAAQCRDLPEPIFGELPREVRSIEPVSLSGDEIATALDSVEAMRHRVRSCLNAVSGYAQLIELDPGDAVQQAAGIRGKVDEVVGVLDLYVWQLRNLLDRNGS